MGAPALDSPEFTGAVDKVFDARLERSGIDLDLIPKKDEVSALREGFEEFNDAFERTLPDKIRSGADDALKAAFERAGLDEESLTHWRSLEEAVKRLDRSGTPDSARSEFNPDGRWRKDSYTKIGRAGVTAMFRAMGMPLPKEYEAMQRAQLGDTDTKGKVTIPELRVDEWSVLARDHSVARKIFESEDLDGELTLIVPTVSSDVDTAEMGTEATTEASETDVDFEAEADSSVSCTVMGAFTRLSRKIPPQRLLKMEQKIGRLLMRAAGWRQDKWIFNNGSSPFNSMMNRVTGEHVMASTKTSMEDSDHRDWSKLIYAIDPNHIGNGLFLLNPTVFGHTTRLVDDNERPIYVTGWIQPQGLIPNAPVSEGPPALLHNRPCWMSTTMPALDEDPSPDTAFGLYFDPEFGTIADSQAPMVEQDDSQERSKFVRRLYLFEVFAFHYSQPSAGASIKTAGS